MIARPCRLPPARLAPARLAPARLPAAGSALAALLLVVCVLLAGPVPARAADFPTQAEEAIAVDLITGRVLMAKNADRRMPTSSMSKLMTLYMVFEAIEEGRLALDDTVTISRRAWARNVEGSKMFIEVGKQVPIEALIRGVAVQSGNDASIALAEAVAGDETLFAEAMTRRARELGLTRSHFVNATGLPDANHYSTARDLAILAARLIEDFPRYYHYWGEREFTWNGISQANRNPLLGEGLGVDGLKTGHTEAAGYGMVASAARDGRRVVVVLNGLDSEAARARETRKLVSWALGQFDVFDLYQPYDTVAEARVWRGEAARVALVVPERVRLTLSPRERRGLAVRLALTEPVPAPIARGDELGQMIIEAPGRAPVRIALQAAAAVPELGFAGRLVANARALILGEAAATAPLPEGPPAPTAAR